MLFAVNGDSSHFAVVEAEAKLDLDYRCELFDEWMAAHAQGMRTTRQIVLIHRRAETVHETGARSVLC